MTKVEHVWSDTAIIRVTPGGLTGAICMLSKSLVGETFQSCHTMHEWAKAILCS